MKKKIVNVAEESFLLVYFLLLQLFRAKSSFLWKFIKCWNIDFCTSSKEVSGCVISMSWMLVWCPISWVEFFDDRSAYSEIIHLIRVQVQLIVPPWEGKKRERRGASWTSKSLGHIAPVDDATTSATTVVTHYSIICINIYIVFTNW